MSPEDPAPSPEPAPLWDAVQGDGLAEPGPLSGGSAAPVEPVLVEPECPPPAGAEAWRPYPSDAAGGHTVVGDVRVMERFYSPELDRCRDVVVYLPPSYRAGGGPYPVVYMHDGQNLFDEATSFAGEWGVDETMEALAQDGLEAIVVGVDNGGAHRLDEYSPFEDAEGRGGDGDRYLAFLTDTLKPRIDADFRTLPGRERTAIAGSSMGGLVSLWAFLRRPDVFGKAAVMSPSLWFADRAVFPVVEATPFAPGRIYLGVGLNEGAETVADARRLRDLLLKKGYRRRTDLLYLEQRGAGHSEEAWRRRFRYAARFLLREKAA